MTVTVTVAVAVAVAVVVAVAVTATVTVTVTVTVVVVVTVPVIVSATVTVAAAVTVSVSSSGPLQQQNDLLDRLYCCYYAVQSCCGCWIATSFPMRSLDPPSPLSHPVDPAANDPPAPTQAGWRQTESAYRAAA